MIQYLRPSVVATAVESRGPMSLSFAFPMALPTDGSGAVAMGMGGLVEAVECVQRWFGQLLRIWRPARVRVRA